ncbi:MAG: hypothetical protein EHM24_22610 [Acidobacteria bacterium]|nr:MAG: hypothetical protein EHM24_22610 [Acidobacteriota bacterium]
MSRAPRRRRQKRCPFCQTLFLPHPRLGVRQQACAAPACQRQRHAANCRDWRRRNVAITQTHYEDYVRPTRAAPGPLPIAPGDLQILLGSLRPEVRDAIMTERQWPRGVSP